MKLKKNITIAIILIGLLLFLSNIVHANMSIEAMRKADWIYERQKDFVVLSLIAMVITLTIELIIAALMKIKNYKIIFFTNIVTQIFLHINTIQMFSYRTYEIEPIITIILELIILFVEFLIYVATFPEHNEKKIFAYVLIANLVTFVAPYVILWNTNNLPSKNLSTIHGSNLLGLYAIIGLIIQLMYFISFIIFLILDKKIDKKVKNADGEDITSLRKKLLFSKISTILFGNTTFICLLSSPSWIVIPGIFTLLAPLISLIIIIEVFIHRFKTKAWY